jgi:hypothetical protein
MALNATTDRPAKVKRTYRLDADLADTIDNEAEHRGTSSAEVVRSTLAAALFGLARRQEGRREPCHR